MRLYISIFILLGIFFIPVSSQFYAIQNWLTEAFFGQFVNWSAYQLNIHWELHDFSSDSTRLMLLLAWLLIFSLPIFFFIKYRKENFVKKIISITSIFSTYFIAWILLKYGFDKLFKAQFYSPEPNILYSKVGDLDKDILFWTSMGSSYSYSVITGLFEIISGILLLFRKTRNLAILLSIGVFVNVLAINVGFDISVKLFAVFLLLTSLYLAAPFARNLWLFLSNQSFKLSTNNEKHIPEFNGAKWLKLLLIFGIFLECLYPFMKNSNFNDDLAERPIYHGAYEVEAIVRGSDTLSPAIANLNRLFFHRDHYLILQDTADSFVDYSYSLNAAQTKIKLIDYNENTKVYTISYNPRTSTLLLKNSKEQLICKALPWKQMALLQPLFHLTVD